MPLRDSYLVLDQGLLGIRNDPLVKRRAEALLQRRAEPIVEPSLDLVEILVSPLLGFVPIIGPPPPFPAKAGPVSVRTAASTTEAMIIFI